MPRSLLPAALSAALLSSPAAAAVTFDVTYEAAGVQNTTAAFNYKGVETFNTRSTGSNQSFYTYYGTNTIAGVYRSVDVLTADQYGGAGGTGRYASTSSGGSYTLDLGTSYGAGINYFGFWLSSLDSGNALTFYDDDTKLFTFDPTTVKNAIGSNSGYKGNPTTAFFGKNSGEQYVFVNLFANNGTFNRIVFSQLNTSGAYESDNHTVGNWKTRSGTAVPQVGAVPEPANWAMMIAGFGLIGTALRRARRQAVAAA